MDPMTAPLGEVLDWLAERDGWKFSCTGWWRRTAGGNTEGADGTHPITLDRLAGMLPEGIGFQVTRFLNGTWSAIACNGIDDGAWSIESPGDDDHDPIEPAARVVAAVLGRQDQP